VIPALPWKALAIGAAGLTLVAWGGLNQIRLATCQVKVAKLDGAYKALSRSIQVQNEAVQDLEKKATAAASRTAQARAAAAKATNTAKQRADALAALLAAPRPISECPSADALVAVRDDLRGRPQTP